MTPPPTGIRVLIAEADVGHARILEDAIVAARVSTPEIVICERLTETCERLAEMPFDIVLLNLVLVDEVGIDCFVRVSAEARAARIIVITPPEDAALGQLAVSTGAFAALTIDDPHLASTLQAAIETLGGHDSRATPTDGHTVFRDGATRLMALARASGKALLLVTVSIDGLDWIRRRFGEQEATQAVSDADSVLRRTFRASDLVERLAAGGFAILAIMNPADNGEEIVTARLDELLDAHKVWNPRQWDLRLIRSLRRIDADIPGGGETVLGEAIARLELLAREG